VKIEQRASCSPLSRESEGLSVFASDAPAARGRRAVDPKEIQLARLAFEIPDTISDDEILDSEAYLRKSGAFNTPDFVRVANFILLKSIREEHLPDEATPGQYHDDDDLLWLCRCERLFVDGLYGASCLWARTTLEHDLQRLCLSKSDIPIQFKERISDPDQRNPSIGECLNQLGIDESSDLHSVCDIIRENGNWVTHHRIDSLADGFRLEDHFAEMGLSKEFVDAVLAKGERDFREKYRTGFERERAIESLRGIYLVRSRTQR